MRRSHETTLWPLAGLTTAMQGAIPMSNMLQPCMTDSVVELVGGNVGGLLEQEKGGFHALFIELLGTVGAM